MDREHKLQQLISNLQRFDKIAVAFSGGVDSTLLLKAAADAIGAQQVLALTVTSPLHPASETDQSRALASRIGAKQLLVELNELDIIEVAANQPRRCYYCKRALFSKLQQLAIENSCSILLDGSNRDDLADYRPGQQALKELQIKSPLLEVGLDKAEVRNLSRQLGLPTWDKPAFACLASRFPYGTRLTIERLQQVERCENWLRQRGFNNYRVRYHDQLARIELVPTDFPRLIEEPLRSQLLEEFRAAGFTYICLDLQGYRIGSMNETLSEQDNPLQ